MNLIPVESSNITAIGYERTTQTLFVRFHSGDTYRVERVPSWEHQYLMRAPSKGKYYHSNIVGRYEIGKVEG